MSVRWSFRFEAITVVWLLAANPCLAQERVRTGYSGISGYQVPLWLGVDLGLFNKYGLAVEPILFRAGAQSTHALTGGKIHKVSGRTPGSGGAAVRRG